MFIPLKDETSLIIEDTLLELASNEGLKIHFQNLVSFGLKAEYPGLSEIALTTFLPCTSAKLASQP